MRYHNLSLSEKSKSLLTDFLNDSGDSLSNFRYYETRSLDVVKNHVMSFLLYDCNICVGYGHLDREEDNIWLGICVKENYIGMGYGNIIMNQLTNSHVGSILLSVDKVNKSAINLYKKYNFVVKSETEDTYIMERK